MKTVTVPTRKVLFLLGIILSFSAYCQKEVKLYEKAEEALESKDYNQALQYYHQVSDIDSRYLDIEFKIEVCSLLTPSGADKPLDQLLQMANTYGEKDPHYFYWLGKIYAHRYQIEEALSAFETFSQRVTYTGAEDEIETKALLAHSKQLKYYFENPDNYEIHQLESPINSAQAELSPVYFEDKGELLFASNRNGSGEEPFKIFYTKSGPDGWSALKEVTNLGTFSRANANIEVVNEDGKLFLFKEEKGGDLFYSQPSGDAWTVPVEFDSKLSNNDLASHFFINEHEDRIIFAADKNNQGLDIYESFKDPEDGKWSKPKPFHSAVNTAYNEDSPYLSPDENKLYFCSDRPAGVGGYDVYVSTFDPETYSWSEPENLGWPINSPDNEFHFKMNTDQTLSLIHI